MARRKWCWPSGGSNCCDNWARARWHDGRVIFKYNSRRPMHTTNLRKVGGSVMLAVPRAILDLLHLEVGATVGLAVDGERMVVLPQPKPKYTLDELLAQSNPELE